MKASELRKKNKEELEKDLREAKANLAGLLFKLAANKLKNVREIRSIKRDVARINTILKEKS